MLIVVDGVVHNSEDDVVSILIFENEWESLVKAMETKNDIYNTYPGGTKPEKIKANVKVLIEAKREIVGG
jgi:hypothetical protein